MSDTVEHLVLSVCWRAGGLVAANARNVTNRQAYQRRVAQSFLEQERERIERWHRDFDVSVDAMASALADGAVPSWWRGQLRTTDHPDLPSPDAQIIPFPTDLIRSAFTQPTEVSCEHPSVPRPTTPTSSRSTRSRRTPPSAP